MSCPWVCSCGYSCKTVERLGIHAAHCRRRFLGLGTIRKWWREAVGVKRLHLVDMHERLQVPLPTDGVIRMDQS